MQVFLFISVVASFTGLSAGQRWSWGKCPSVTVQDNFDIEKYMGKWYENRRFFAIFEAFSDCVMAEYTLLDDGTVKVNNTGYNQLRGRFVTAIGNAAVEGDNPAKLGVRFSAAQPRGDYWVLSTDYDNYSIVWSCTEVLRVFNLQFAWILTRAPEGVSSQTIRELYSLMSGFGINTSRFHLTNQANCGR